MRKEFSITAEQREKFDEIAYDDDRQANINDLWKLYGLAGGFEGMSVRPLEGGFHNLQNFTAEEVK